MERKIRERGKEKACFFGKAFFSKERFMLKDERGQLSIDFLVGISLFILALLFMAHFIPGMFVPFQSETIDLNSVAYRTSVILVEDPGWWDDGTGAGYGTDWDTEEHIGSVSRVGLAIDKEHPNLLKWSKIEGFKTYTDLTDKLGLYRMIGSNPIYYGYNITIVNSSKEIHATMGDSVPEYGDVASMKRIVWTRLPPVADISNESLEGTDSPSKALLYINGTDISKEGILEDGILIAITNFTIPDPDKTHINTYESIEMANSVEYAAGVGWKLKIPTGDIDDDGGYTSLLNYTNHTYDPPQYQSLKKKRTIYNVNDTLEIFLAKSVFFNNSKGEGGKLEIDGSMDLYIELQFGNGIVILNPGPDVDHPGTYLKPLLVTDYESMELIIKVWE